MTEGAPNTFGGLSSILEKFQRSYLEGQGTFDEHTVFLLGPPLVVPETQRVTFAVSSENQGTGYRPGLGYKVQGPGQGQCPGQG